MPQHPPFLRFVLLVIGVDWIKIGLVDCKIECLLNIEGGQCDDALHDGNIWQSLQVCVISNDMDASSLLGCFSH